MPQTHDKNLNSHVITGHYQGGGAKLVHIESSFTKGFAGIQMIGNLSEVCKDGKERARSALEKLGITLPAQRVVLSLTPADFKKDGNHYDLPIAVSIFKLLRPEAIKRDLSRWLFAAELGLDGRLRPVRSISSFAIAAKAHGLEGIIAAPQNLEQICALIKTKDCQLQVQTFHDLASLVEWINGHTETSTPPFKHPQNERAFQTNFDDMNLSNEQKKIALVCAAGGHSLFLQGPPGTGKSMFAQRIPSILPKMTQDDHITSMQIHSSMKETLSQQILAGIPPFRSPHHQASSAAIMGTPECPGEISLAHGGILFLDELPEFRRDLVESLREPLEAKCVHISRSGRRASWPANFILIAAANLCPCGWRNSTKRECRCPQNRIDSYRAKISGPIENRIDIHYNMPELRSSNGQFFLDIAQNSSQTADLQERVKRARQFSAKRNQSLGCRLNSELTSQMLVEAMGQSRLKFTNLINQVIPNYASRRSTIRCLRIARTLADLRQDKHVSSDDLQTSWGWQSESAAINRGEDIRSIRA